MEKLESKVKNAIDKYGLINKNERVLVGLSGGADSVALLHVLLKIAPERGFELCAAHLNHGIRGAEAYHGPALRRGTVQRAGGAAGLRGTGYTRYSQGGGQDAGAGGEGEAL